MEAVQQLREGNARFVSGHGAPRPRTDKTRRRRELVAGQHPFAIVLGCSDSRVPPEIIFDQGLGDLFVIRVAGNVVAHPQAGSIELAAKGLGTRLIVVLGHSMCGAVLATLDTITHADDTGNPVEKPSPGLRALTDRIRPSVEALLATDPRADRQTLVQRTVRANIRASAEQLRHESPVLEKLIRSEELLVVGAEYSLETGVVDFFDGLPATG